MYDAANAVGRVHKEISYESKIEYHFSTVHVNVRNRIIDIMDSRSKSAGQCVSL